MKSLPKKLGKSPILSAAFELRFESDIPKDAIFGLVYNIEKNKFQSITKLPILELPDAVRQTDQNLKYQPYHQLSNSEYILQVGPKVISLHPISYLGWTVFFKEIENLLSDIWKIQIIKRIERVGLRYINVFPQRDILSQIKLEIKFNDQSHSSDNLFFRTVISSDIYNTTVQITNKANFAKKNILQEQTGSLIDLDTFFTFDNLELEKLIQSITKSHQITKESFFSMLKDTLLQELNPEYANE